MKVLSPIVLISFCTAFYPLRAQSVDSAFLNAAYNKLLSSKAYTLGIAERMPSTHYSFKPTAEEMTFGEQLLHLAKNLQWLSSHYLNNGQQNPIRNPATGMDKDSIMNVLTQTYEHALKALKQFPPHHLTDTVAFFAGPMTKLQIINLINDHQTHHRAQIIVYLRIKGIKPPPYRGW